MLPVRRWLRVRLALPLGLPQHPDQHGPKRPILLAVDQERLCGWRMVRPPRRAHTCSRGGLGRPLHRLNWGGKVGISDARHACSVDATTRTGGFPLRFESLA